MDRRTAVKFSLYSFIGAVAIGIGLKISQIIGSPPMTLGLFPDILDASAVMIAGGIVLYEAIVLIRKKSN